MNHNGQLPDQSAFVEFEENRSRFPPEALIPFAGQHVAWSPDGRRILTSAGTPEELEHRLMELGIPEHQAVLGYVDPL